MAENEILQSTAVDENNDYNASEIQVLEGLEAVRKRPGMYIGSTSVSGLHHLVYEIVDNSIDEALAGYCTEIKVTINEGNTITVVDNGRGIPVDIQAQTGRPALEVVYTVLHAGGKFGGGGYKVSGGLHGVGASVVNALSEWLEVNVHKNGKIYQMKFSRGETTQAMTVVGETDHTGTTVRFKPDPVMFEDTVYDYETLHVRMREQAFLNAGLRITITDLRGEQPVSESMCYEGGIREFVDFINRNKTALHPEAIYMAGERSDSMCEIALQYNDGYNEVIVSFANNIHTPEGGMHETGFKAALTRALNSYGKKSGILKEGDSISGEDSREGLTAVISVKLTNPQFEGQTKAKLGNSEMRALVDSVVFDRLSQFLEENPVVGRTIIEKALTASRAREAARRARENIRRKNGLEGFNMPDKLRDCNDRDPSLTELYIVEGDSALGSVKLSRDGEFQGIMPVRGKILNCLKADYARIFKSDVITDLMRVLGCGVEVQSKQAKDLSAFSLENLRWNKVIICTDADVDGFQIRTLILTMLYRLAPTLIREGYVYIAESPLYEIVSKGKTYFAYSDREKAAIVDGLGGAKADINRSKGLGENDPEMMWLTTMNPDTRKLIRVMPEDVERTAQMFDLLLGDNLAGRKAHIAECGSQFLDLADIS